MKSKSLDNNLSRNGGTYAGISRCLVEVLFALPRNQSRRATGNRGRRGVTGSLNSPASRPHSLLAALLWLLIPEASAATEYVGSYSRGGVDSAEQLVVLQDRTFCYAVMAGTLDLLAGGRWQPATDASGGIELHEVKAERAIFQAVVRADGSGQIEFDFHGHSFAYANLAAFGVSTSDSNPTTLRPLFAQGMNNWSPNYRLPPMTSTQARYFFIAHVPNNGYESETTDMLEVTAYALEGRGEVRIGFDRIQAMPPLQMHASLQGETLWMDDYVFGTRAPLSDKLIADARRECIVPALAEGSKMAQDAEPGWQRLRPLRSFKLPTNAIQGAPWFPNTNDN